MPAPILRPSMTHFEFLVGTGREFLLAERSESGNDHAHRRDPAWFEKVTHPGWANAVISTRTAFLAGTSTLQDQELMTEGKNLCLQNQTGPETIAQTGE